MHIAWTLQLKTLAVLLLLQWAATAEVTVLVPNSVNAKTGEKLVIPCDYGPTGSTFQKLRWAEMSGVTEGTVYTYAPGGVDTAVSPPWREPQDMERYSRQGFSLQIRSFQAEDSRQKCCEITTKDPAGSGMACTDILLSDGSDVKLREGHASTVENCDCMEKTIALGIVTALSVIILVALIIYVVRFLD